MSDVHVLFLKGTLSQRDALHDLVGEGALRASASTLGGTYYGIGVGTYAALADDTAGGGTLEDAYRLVCPSDDEPPCNLAILRPVRGVVSMLEPREFVCFVLVTLGKGGIRRWRDRVAELAVADGVEDAVALTFGLPGVHAVVELVSDDLEALQERLLELVDLDEVEDFDVLHTAAARTRGFGGRKGLAS